MTPGTTQMLAMYAEQLDTVDTVRLIETRATWPQKNMQFVRALYDWGILRNEPIKVNGRVG